MNLKALLAFIGVGMLIVMAGARGSLADGDQSRAVAATLDAFHLAASKADFDGYFGHFAADGVFLGTDATERWTVDEFKAFAKPSFDKGHGWTYTAIEGRRFITVADNGAIAWFDELLANEKYGTCRGSGVLRQVGGNWRIVQYNLAFMVPNEAAKDVVALIQTKQR